MTESKFHGVIPPVVIPLTAERTLDLEALEGEDVAAIRAVLEQNGMM